MDLLGRHIWLVGASEGIGAALAKALADQGAFLALSARSEDKLKAVAAEIPGARPLLLPLDVTKPETIAAAWHRVSTQWPQLDQVIYNAGAYEPMTAQEFDLAKIESMIDVNLHGALRVMAHALPYFIARDAGAITLVASVAGYRGLPAAMGYGLSKAALILFAENLRADLARTNVTVHLVNPGFVETRLTAQNQFHMPAMVSAKTAAEAIVQGLRAGRFEIHFPKRFTRVLKLLRILPYGLYFALLRAVKW